MLCASTRAMAAGLVGWTAITSFLFSAQSFIVWKIMVDDPKARIWWTGAGSSDTLRTGENLWPLRTPASFEHFLNLQRTGMPVALPKGHLARVQAQSSPRKTWICGEKRRIPRILRCRRQPAMRHRTCRVHRGHMAPDRVKSGLTIKATP